MRRAFARLLAMTVLAAGCAPPPPGAGPDDPIAPAAEVGPERPELSPAYERVQDILRRLPPPGPAGR